MFFPRWLDFRDGDVTGKAHRSHLRRHGRRSRVLALGAAAGGAVYRIERLEPRHLLSTVTWISSAGGSWSTPTDWSTGVLPQAGDDVVINQPGNIQIAVSGSVSVNSVTLTGDTLAIQAGATLSTAATMNNSGTINVSGSGQIAVGGAYAEATGAILSLPGGGDPTFPTTNWLANADFESPAAAGSTTKPPGTWSSYGSAYVSTQYAYTGAQSLVMSGPSTAAVQTFTATPGASYTMSGYAMTPASNPLTAGEYAEIQIEFFNSSGTQISTWSKPYDDVILTASSASSGPLTGSVGSQGWNHFSTTATAPAGTASVHAFVDTHCISGPYGGVAYYDDVTFGPAAANSSKLSAASVSNSGAITVGPTNTITTTGAFAQTSTGTLDIQLGSAPTLGNYGSVAVGGAATLAGTLQAQTVYGYTPSNTDTFTPITFASESGTFSTYSLPSGAGYQFDAASSFTNVVISAVPTAAVTATVNAASVFEPVPTQLLGINVTYVDKDAVASQTQQIITAAGLQLLRIPGGSYSDDWHFNVNYTATTSNDNNLPPLLQFIASVAATGLVTLDYGSASPQEDAAELAYAIGSPTDTTILGNGIQWNDTTSQWQTVNWGTVGYWASLRAASPLTTNDGLNFLRIAHPAPFTNAKYWEVGNEEYGTWETDHHGTNLPSGTSTGAQHDPATYAAFAETFATFAAEITAAAGVPAISIGVDSGDPTAGAYNGWIQGVLTDGLADGFIPGFISDHNYMFGTGLQLDASLLNDTDTQPGNVLNWSTRYADYESMLKQTFSAQQAASVQLLGTEYNSSSAWSSNSTKQSTSLVNGLFVANSIGSLLDSGYQGGCLWDLRDGWSTADNNNNVLYGWREGATLGQLGDWGYNTPPANSAYVAFPGYYALQLASKMLQSGGEVISASSNYAELNTYSVLEPNGHLDLMVVNTNPAAALTEQFNLSGFQPNGAAQIWQYGQTQDTAQSHTSNGAAALGNFGTTLSLTGANFSYSFPAYSMTVIDLTPKTVTTSVVTSGNTPATYGQPVTFTATVTPSSGSGETGSVQFQIDGSYVGGAIAVNNNTASYTTSSLSLGSHSVVAIYSGDSNFAASTSATYWQNVVAAPNLFSADSQMAQGAAGTFEIPLPSDGSGIECRTLANGLSIVINFDQPILGGSASVTAGVATVGAVSYSGDSMIVPLSGVGNGQSITITCSNVTDTAGGVLSSSAVSFRTLTGAVRGNPTVGAADILAVRFASASGFAVSESNFRCDVMCDGSIGAADILAVRFASAAMISLSGNPTTDTPPTISAIANQNAVSGVQTAPIAFTIGDAESDPSTLGITATSSDQTVVLNTNLVISGSGAARTISITPVAGLATTSTITITLTVSDGLKSTSTTFNLTVSPST